MILKIRSAGDPVLRERAMPLKPEDILSPRTQDLIASLRETMRDAPGVGLAAPQVGLALQLAVIEDREEYMKDIDRSTLSARERKPVPFQVIINPVVTFSDTTPEVEFFEGCLSLPSMMALVPRLRKIKVNCLDEHAKPKVIEATGWHARILQHEIDHLCGTLYVDRMQSLTLCSLENYNRHWKSKSVAEVKRLLPQDAKPRGDTPGFDFRADTIPARPGGRLTS